MGRGVRRLLLGLAGVAVVGGIVVLLAPLVVDVDRFRPRVEERLSSMTGRPVTLGPLRFTLWPGPAVAGSSLRVAGEPGVESGPFRIHLMIWPLLRGEPRPGALVVEGGRVARDGRAVLEEGILRARIRALADGATRVTGRIEGRVPLLDGRPRAESAFTVRVAPGKLEVESFTTSIGSAIVEASGTASGFGTGTIEGRLEGSAKIAGLTLSALEAEGRHASGVFRLTRARFDLYGGRAEAEGHVRVAEPRLPFEIEAELSDVRVEGILAALAPRLGGVLEGTLRGSLELSGEAARALAQGPLAGRARVEIASGTLKSVGIVKQAARLLELAGGGGIGRDETPFDRIAGTFVVGQGVARTDDLAFRSADLDLDGGGTIGLDGTLHLDVVSSFSASASAKMVAETPQLRFRVDPSGRLTLPMKIRGTLASPVVQIDVDRVLKEGLERELRDKTRGGWLRKLIGRD